MDSGTGIDVASSQQLRNTIEQTRMALSEKIAALNHEVRDTLSDASSRVRRRFHEARESVDPSIQFHRHPWAFCFGAAVVGFVLRRRFERGYPASAQYSGEPAELIPQQLSTPQKSFGSWHAPDFSVRAALVPFIAEVLAGVLQRRRYPERG